MEKIIINDYIRGEPLAEENLDGVLDLVNKIRLLSPKKSIWLYTGFTWEDILDEDYNFLEMHDTLRQAIVAQCDVLVDGQYIESQRNISLPYRGSSNQRLVDIQQTLQKGEIVLWQT